MKKLNKFLVSQLKEGKHAVKFDRNNDSLDDLRFLLTTVFPKDPFTAGGASEYYQAGRDSKIEIWGGYTSTSLPYSILSDFFTDKTTEVEYTLTPVGKPFPIPQI